MTDGPRFYDASDPNWFDYEKPITAAEHEHLWRDVTRIADHEQRWVCTVPDCGEAWRSPR